MGQYTSSLSETAITSDVVYYTIHNDKEVYLSADEFLNDNTPYDTNPLVYYRLTHPLKEGVELPTIDLTKCYTELSNYGYEFEIQPNFQYVTNAKLIEAHPKEWQTLTEAIEKFPAKYDKELMKAMNQLMSDDAEITKEELSSLKPKDMKFKEKSRLNKLPNDVKKIRTMLIYMYNVNFFRSLRYQP